LRGGGGGSIITLRSRLWRAILINTDRRSGRRSIFIGLRRSLWRAIAVGSCGCSNLRSRWRAVAVWCRSRSCWSIRSSISK